MQQVPQCYYPPQQYQYGMQPQYNAVKIDIINPQANAPAMNPSQSGYYTYPTTPMYGPAHQMIPYPYQPAPAVPSQVVPTQPQTAGQVPPPMIPVAQNPQPTVVPPSIIQVSQTPQQGQQQVMPQPVPAQPQQAQAPEIKPAEPMQTALIDSYNSQLKSPDLNIQFKALDDMIKFVDTQPQKAVELVDEKVLQSLLEILAKDTSKLEAATPERTAIRQRIINGEKVSPQEEAEAQVISPYEAAEKNKQLSIVAITLLQKLAINEVETKHNKKVDITQVPCLEQIVQTAKSNPNPILRATSLEALGVIAKPEYKPVLTQIFELAKQDQDPTVREIAAKTLEDVSKM